MSDESKNRRGEMRVTPGPGNVTSIRRVLPEWHTGHNQKRLAEPAPECDLTPEHLAELEAVAHSGFGDHGCFEGERPAGPVAISQGARLCHYGCLTPKVQEIE
ncbi:MAG: hypothetical protein SFW64_08380 [Alphaproteobacteria bacterium]|nr:hypothetical protein [Alphaproteobacteria bacterium]